MLVATSDWLSSIAGEYSLSGQNDLESWIYERLDAASELSPAAQYAIMGALIGEQALDGALEIGTSAARSQDPPGDVEKPTPVFLESIVVEGFRGIGEPSTLTISPTPGLTVIAGRNGSGKSSFAEALEYALTGTTQRARKRSQLWGDQWRNIHYGKSSKIAVSLVAEGIGRLTVGMEWDADSELDGCRVWSQVTGYKRQQGLESLGWSRALELYRPMLSYDGLGGIVEAEPSRLFDALEGFLGLERLTEAASLLSSRVRLLGEPAKIARSKKTLALSAVADLDDDRARAATQILRRHRPDLTAATALLINRGQDDDATLRALLELQSLTVAESVDIEKAAKELTTAAREVRDITNQIADQAADRGDLLAAALNFHRAHGDQPCPVCGEGQLDEAWQERVRAELDATKHQAAARTAAQSRLRAARQIARDLIDPVPACVAAAGPELAALPAVRDAWGRWVECPDDDGSLASHLAELHAPLCAALEALRRETAEKVATRQTEWAQAAIPFATWIEVARAAEANRENLDTVTLAGNWLKQNIAALRNQRLEPLADQAPTIWAALRQESNVDLGAITLEGSATRRRVDLRARVDGADAGALAVMSQGELHALALALFIPRATAAASPFGFVVLDDPIQAMDPSKVDGFARVLADLAATRQVVVFTHDDRLPDAIRAMGLQATLTEIVRSACSQVTARPIDTSADRYIEDAAIVAQDPHLSAEDKARIIPGLCRFAVEAACHDLYFSRRLKAGESRHDVESQWSVWHQTRDRVMAALDVDQHGFDSWLKKPYRSKGLGIITTAAHRGLNGDPRNAVEDVTRFVRDLLGR